MKTTKTIHHRTSKLLAITCLSLGFGFAHTEAITAQSQLGTGSYWKPLECVSNAGANPLPNTSERESGNRDVLASTSVDPNSENGVSRETQIFMDADSLKKLSARRRTEAASSVDHYLGKPTAWQGYPSAQAVPLPPKQDASKTNPSVTPLIIRSPFADFSTRIPTNAAANPSQKNAETCFRNGDYAEARSSVEGALRLDPNNGNLVDVCSNDQLGCRRLRQSRKTVCRRRERT